MISPELSLPIDAVTQTFAAIGRKGAGKTYLASMLAEQMLDFGAQTVVIDPVGNWYGLRVGADGKSKGKEIFVAITTLTHKWRPATIVVAVTGLLLGFFLYPADHFLKKWEVGVAAARAGQCVFQCPVVTEFVAKSPTLLWSAREPIVIVNEAHNYDSLFSRVPFVDVELRGFNRDGKRKVGSYGVMGNDIAMAFNHPAFVAGHVQNGGSLIGRYSHRTGRYVPLVDDRDTDSFVGRIDLGRSVHKISPLGNMQRRLGSVGRAFGRSSAFHAPICSYSLRSGLVYNLAHHALELPPVFIKSLSGQISGFGASFRGNLHLCKLAGINISNIEANCEDTYFHDELRIFSPLRRWFMAAMGALSFGWGRWITRFRSRDITQRTAVLGGIAMAGGIILSLWGVRL